MTLLTADRGRGGPLLRWLALGNFPSSFWAPCKAPKYNCSIGFLIARTYFGRLARRPKALKKFASWPGWLYYGGAGAAAPLSAATQ